MAQKLTAALPPDLDLPANFIVQISALAPATGLVVAGVNVSNVAILAATSTPDTADGGLPPGPLPIFVPLAVG